MKQPVLAQHSPRTDVKMRAILVLLAAMVAVAYAAGQYYVPRSYYTIDSDGHETAPVPLRRLRRSMSPYPYANNADPRNGYRDPFANGGGNAQAISIAGQNFPGIGAGLGASKPDTSAGITRSQSGTVKGRSVSASTFVGTDSSGDGYYDQTATIY